MYSNPFKALAEFHTFFKLLWLFRDWNTIGAVYHQLPFPRSALYDKLKKLVESGLLIKRSEDGVNYYRVVSRRIVIPEFGAVELSEDRPMIYVFIDPIGDFVRRLKWRPDDVYVVVWRGGNGSRSGDDSG